MLILSRRREQSIVIETPAGQVTVMVTDIRGDKVRIGVEAPRAITVHRAEVQKRIEQERKAG